MKIIIRPPIEIDVDGKYCNTKCSYFKKTFPTIFSSKAEYRCKCFEYEQLIEVGHGFIRCQACVEAEKEA